MLIKVRTDAESKLITCLRSMQDEGELCDFTIRTGGTPVLAHKCILAASLEYFRTSFRFSSSSSPSNETSIDLSHLKCDADVIRKVVQSLYSNEVNITDDDVSGVLQLADYFMYNDLMQAIELYMQNTLHISNAALFFQLCLQYGFDKSTVFTRVCVLLSSRMHDYLIYQASSFDWGLDVMDMMMRYNLFDFCTPLQMTNFILQKLEILLSHSHLYAKEELNKTSLAILNILELFFAHIDKSTLFKWGEAVTKQFNTCMKSNSEQLSNMDDVHANLIMIQSSAKMTDKEVIANDNIAFSQISQGDNSVSADAQGSLIAPISTTTSFTSEKIENNTIASSETNYDGFWSVDTSSESSSIPQSTNNKSDESMSSNQSPHSSSITMPPHDKNLIPFLNESHHRNFCKGLVVLSPSHEMVSQLMEVEYRKAKPLLKSPQLSLHFYDVDLCVWRFGGNLAFPLPGHMMEKHAWRMAYVNKSLFLFSLTKRKGLEYNTESGEWTELSCEIIFERHFVTTEVNEDDAGNEENNQGLPVKSVIPISMEDNLVVLSMSRQSRSDYTFWTQQHIYQFDPETRTFKHVTCARDSRMALPMTKWTVDGSDLVTVKASTMMFADIQMFNVQHIHFYNSKSQVLETHHVDCAMKSGLKIFLQKKKLYLLNNFSEYRVYSLETRNLSDWIRLSNFSPYLNCGVPGLEVSYPAGVRTSCHAGSSRWILNSNFNVGSASLSELHVTENGDFMQKCHPNPPFLYMMTMCSAKLDQTQMDCLSQATFLVRNTQDQ